MKPCAFCKNYVAPSSTRYWSVPAMCHSPNYPSFRDQVSGNVIGGQGDCAECRSNESKCGAKGVWFVVVDDLDARLEALKTEEDEASEKAIKELKGESSNVVQG